MRILILSNSDIGLYKFRKELLQELTTPGSIIQERKASKCKVFIALPDGSYISEIKKTGCKIIKTFVDRRGMNPFKDLKLINQYRVIIKRVKPDIVLTYTIKPNIYGGILCGIKRIKYIPNITGLGTSIEDGNFISKIILLMYKAGLYNAATVFFQNKVNKEFFMKKKIAKEGIVLPGSGVNLEENCYENYPEEDGTIRFLFIGRIMKDKGISEFLDCASYIKNKYPFTQFDVLGEYDEDSYRTNIEYLQEKGIVHYYGQQDDVHSFLKNHHATILPTYHEGLSNVLLESAASGRPVIATNIPGCQEAFDEGITGIGFKPRNKKDLIRAVEQFISLPYDKKRQMGIAARAKVLEEFDRKIVVKAYLKAMNIQ